MVFVALPSSPVVNAFASALRGWHLIGACGILSAINMMSARGKLVRVTHRLIAIVATGDYAVGFHVRPSKLGDSAIAPMVFKDVAGRQVLC